jgi:hypothetical protein
MEITAITIIIVFIAVATADTRISGGVPTNLGDFGHLVGIGDRQEIFHFTILKNLAMVHLVVVH